LCLFSVRLLAVDAIPQGRIGIMGDSIAAGTHSSEMCRNQDIVDCVQDLAGQHSRQWSYAGGSRSWSIANELGYGPDRVVDASDDGEEWKDALDQAIRIMADQGVETVFIGLGANDVCQVRGHDYSGDLDVVASHIDETLAFLTDTLPSGGSIYWSGVPDVVRMRDLMRTRDHNLLFKTCQATWDLDKNEIREGMAEDACDHYFSKSFCATAGGQGQAVDLLVQLLVDNWLSREGIQEGPCGKVLNSGSTDQDRAEARGFTIALNRLMAQKARAWTGRNGVNVYYNDRVFHASRTIQPHHLSRVDCYHPSRSGQMKFAYEIWDGFDLGSSLTRNVLMDEFSSTDYCTQEFTDWGTCWVETNDDNTATAGDIRIVGNALQMRRASKEIARGMDLHDVDRAWISFNRRRDNLDHLGDYVDFEVSRDAGLTWLALDSFTGEATDFGFQRGNYYDISQFATADTRIRFVSSPEMGENDRLFVDNVKVVSWNSRGARDAPPVDGDLTLGGSWQSVATPAIDSPPVVFTGVATDSAGGTGIAAVRNVGTQQFEVRLQEVDTAEGDVSPEDVPFLVLQTGTYVMPDGAQWEVGTFAIRADGAWQSKVFDVPFADTPFLFLSLQSDNDAALPVLHARTVGPAGFDVASSERGASGSAGLTGTAGYLAIYSPGNAGTVRIADTDRSYRLQHAVLDGTWTPVLDTFLRRSDGVSEDARISAQPHDVLALGGRLFAQQVSDAGADAAVPQRIASGVRGPGAAPLTVAVTGLTPDTWPLGARSTVTLDLSMPGGFAFREIDATTIRLRQQALAFGFDAQSGRLSVPFADLEAAGLLVLGENRLSVTGELFDDTAFQAQFTLIVTGSLVPDVVGLGVAEAERSLQSAGLTVGQVEEEQTTSVSQGRVLRQSLKPATQVPSLTSVDLVVAAAAPNVASAGSGSGGGGCSYSTGHPMDPVLLFLTGLCLVRLRLKRRQPARSPVRTTTSGL
jgi:hypothetical protein